MAKVVEVVAPAATGAEEAGREGGQGGGEGGPWVRLKPASQASVSATGAGAGAGAAGAGATGGGVGGSAMKKKKEKAITPSSLHSSPPSSSPSALSSVVSLLVDRAWEVYRMDVDEEEKEKKEEGGKEGGKEGGRAFFLCLVDLLELLGGLVASFPQAAQAVQKHPLSPSLPPHGLPSFLQFLLYALLPTPRSPSSFQPSSRRGARRVLAAQAAARLLVVLCVRSAEVRRKVSKGWREGGGEGVREA